MTDLALSVVVPSVNGLGDLIGCLEALHPDRQQVSLEVLVADRVGEDLREAVRSRFPYARVIDAAPTATIPQLRAMAFRSALAPAVAVIEDHVIAPAAWARQLLTAQNGTGRVIGGSVENAATDTFVDWAAFLCEYSAALPPLPAGPADWLVGNNVIYPRALLARYSATLDEGRWENVLHDAMRRDGVVLECRPEISVGHKKHYRYGEYFSQRYLYSRAFAGTRFPDPARHQRLLWGASALMLPPVLLARIVRRLFAKRRHRLRAIATLPLLSGFVIAWGVGEAVGYWLGPGDALRKVC